MVPTLKLFSRKVLLLHPPHDVAWLDLVRVVVIDEAVILARERTMHRCASMSVPDTRHTADRAHGTQYSEEEGRDPAYLLSILLLDFGDAAFAIEEIVRFAEGVGPILEQVLLCAHKEAVRVG